MGVDQDAAVTGDPSDFGKALHRHAADPQQHDVGVEAVEVDPLVEAQVDPGLPVSGVQRGGHSGRGHPRQNAVLHFVNSDGFSRLGGGRCHFEADEAGPDDGDGLGFGQRCAKGVGVVAGLEGEAAVFEPLGHRNAPGRATGGDDQVLIGQRARRGGDGSCSGIDGCYSLSQPQFDVFIGVEGFGSEGQAVAREFALQIGLGQRWLLVGQVGLIADERDGRRVALEPELGGGLIACLTRADDYCTAVCHGRSPSERRGLR